MLTGQFPKKCNPLHLSIYIWHFGGSRFLPGDFNDDNQKTKFFTHFIDQMGLCFGICFGKHDQLQCILLNGSWRSNEWMNGWQQLINPVPSLVKNWYWATSVKKSWEWDFFLSLWWSWDFWRREDAKDDVLNLVYLNRKCASLMRIPKYQTHHSGNLQKSTIVVLCNSRKWAIVRP